MNEGDDGQREKERREGERRRRRQKMRERQEDEWALGTQKGGPGNEKGRKTSGTITIKLLFVTQTLPLPGGVPQSARTRWYVLDTDTYMRL